MPADSRVPIIELFRNHCLQALRDGKLVSPSRLAAMLSWKHSGLHSDGGERRHPAGWVWHRAEPRDPTRSEAITKSQSSALSPRAPALAMAYTPKANSLQSKL